MSDRNAPNGRGLGAAVDFARVAAAALDGAKHLLPEWLPRGAFEGGRFTSGGVDGSEGRSLSVDLRTGRWIDFATDEAGGDLVSLYAAVRGLKQGAAARELSERLGLSARAAVPGSATPQPAATARASSAADAEGESGWVDAGPWSETDPPAPVAHLVRGRPEASWCYRDAAGAVLGYTHRFPTSAGGKIVLPCVWSRHVARGALAWRWRAFSEPRPLYGLPAVAQRPEAPVLVVEGEKCADAAQAVLGAAWVVVTWPGGSKAPLRADWQPLAGRDVVIWPDADAECDKSGALKPAGRQGGQVAADRIAERLIRLGCRVRMVRLPQPGTLPHGFDVADVIAGAAPATPAEAVAEWLADDRLVTVSPPPRAAGSVAVAAPTPAKAARAAGGGGDDSSWTDRLRTNRNGVEASLANLTLIMRCDPRWRGVLAFDEFAQRTLKRAPPPYTFARAGEWDSEDDSRTAIWMSDAFSITVRADLVAEAVETIARENRFHPVREYLRALTWDGERRLHSWLSDVTGCDDTEYTRAVSRFFLRGMVRRVMQPGCKFDYALVLEGEEGRRKSTFCAVLGGPWYSDTDLDLTHKDSMSALRGKWLHEFSEMDSVTRAEASKQKSFLSRSIDEFRPVYGRREIRCPRQCVFVGTTNEDEYIKQGQGARRFWPVRVGREIDIDLLRTLLPQLFAEAVADYEADEAYYPSPSEQSELFMPQQRRRVVQESLVDALHDWVLEPDAGEIATRALNDGAFSIAAAADRCLKISYAQLTRDLQTRIGTALHALGCTKFERRNGMTRYWYKPPQKAATSSDYPLSDEREGDPLPL